MARLSILTNDEINALYKLPILSDEERPYLFDLDDQDRVYIDSIDNIAQKINYILQLGYYRSVSYFFALPSIKLKKMFILYCNTTSQSHHFLGMASQSTFVIKIGARYAKNMVLKMSIPTFYVN